MRQHIAAVADMDVFMTSGRVELCREGSPKFRFDVAALPDLIAGLRQADKIATRLEKVSPASESANLREGVIRIYTDGSASWPNDGNANGGWGVVIYDGPVTRELSGGDTTTTNMRMELQACIEALKALPEASVVMLFSDCKYVVDGMAHWLAAWKRRGWKTADKNPVKNVDLWRQLDQEAQRHRVTWNWVKSHSGVPGNERADVLAKRGMHEQSKTSEESEAAADLEMIARAHSY